MAVTYTSPEIKIRTLAALNATMQADFYNNGFLPKIPAFRWYNQQLQPGTVANNMGAGPCVTVERVSTTRAMNMGGIMNLSLNRIMIKVYDLDSEDARRKANDIVNFMGTIDLCSQAQFQSPVGSISQNPSLFVGQRQELLPNPQSPSGPIWVQVLDFKVYNREDFFFG
jgi:hypothetical protein